MKNKGHFQALNKKFFIKHQHKLLWLLNAPLISMWFRWVLGIDCKEKIYEIEPNNYKVYLGMYLIKGRLEHKIKADFRSHNKYSKRLYFAFKPLWWTMHFFDWLVLDNYLPRHSFGFTTLTVYPDANPETNTVDGYVRYQAGSSDWATIQAAAAGDFADDSSANPISIFSYFNKYGLSAGIGRGFFLFDTSSLGASATISAATIDLYATYKLNEDNDGDDYVVIVSSNPATNTALITADYDQVGATAYSDTIDITGITTSAYNTWTLNATGIAAISKTSISKFGGREGHDMINSSPLSATENTAQFDSADQTGTTQDPKLVVTYTIAYTITTAVGSFTLTGIASAFYKALGMIASVGSFTLTGVSALFSIGKGIVASVGSFTLTGIDTAFTKALKMAGAVGSFTLTGIDAGLGLAFKITATVGSFILTMIDIIKIRASTSWTNQSKNTSSWTNQSKNTSSWDNEI